MNCCNNNVNNNNYKDIKLTSHKINDRSPLTHKNSNKKILNFNLSNKSVGKGIGNVFKEGNSSHHIKQQLKIIKAVKNKFSMLNKNKSSQDIAKQAQLESFLYILEEIERGSEVLKRVNVMIMAYSDNERDEIVSTMQNKYEVCRYKGLTNVWPLPFYPNYH